MDGVDTRHYTGGFYRVGEGTAWSKFARGPSEQILCDACMHNDPDYRAERGMD